MPALILVNGASSAGKTTLCRALRDGLPGAFVHFSLDFFLFDTSALPRTPQGRLCDWPALRPRVFEGFNRCLPALLDAGNDLVVDYIIETPQMWGQLSGLLRGYDVFLVGLECPVEELERREQARGDRGAGDARRDARTVHTFTRYDLTLTCAAPLEDNVARVALALAQREHAPGYSRRGARRSEAQIRLSSLPSPRCARCSGRVPGRSMTICSAL